jgi:hypothetical protein
MEGYDHDGVEDMPGLRYAHRYLQIEDEAENLGDSWVDGPACGAHGKDSEARFRCGADEYGEMLKLAYPAAHAANPDAKIFSFSFNFGGLDVRLTHFVTSLNNQNLPDYPEEEFRPSDSIPVDEIPIWIA